MIIDFAIENFLSIREQQRFSFVASGRLKDLPENTIELNVPGMKKDVKLLKSAIIYGSNASGKTNVLKGLSFLRNAVILSHISLKPGQPFPLSPFKLDEHSSSEPTRFEINFILDDVRFEYGLSLVPDRVIEERLHTYPLGVRSRWFERKLSESKYEYLYGTRFKPDKVVEDKTRPNSLYLSTGAQLNRPDLKKIYSWFEDLQIQLFGPDPEETARYILDNQQQAVIAELLTHADLGISGLRIDRVDIDVAKRMESIPDDASETTKEAFQSLAKAIEVLAKELGPDWLATDVLTTKMVHRKPDSGEEALFDFREESAGTQRYYSLLAPWLKALANGKNICIDEIERSLHPLLSRRLIEGFHNSDLNKHSAQLLVTTHDATLLDQDLFRRDQIWFTEKDENVATVLYPLTDFFIRKGDKSLQKSYLAGRFGAIPILGAGISHDDTETSK